MSLFILIILLSIEYVLILSYFFKFADASLYSLLFSLGRYSCYEVASNKGPLMLNLRSICSSSCSLLSCLAELLVLDQLSISSMLRVHLLALAVIAYSIILPLLFSI